MIVFVPIHTMRHTDNITDIHMIIGASLSEPDINDHRVCKFCLYVCMYVCMYVWYVRHLRAPPYIFQYITQYNANAQCSSEAARGNFLAHVQLPRVWGPLLIQQKLGGYARNGPGARD